MVSSGVLTEEERGCFTLCFERELVVRSACHMEKLMQRSDAR